MVGRCAILVAVLLAGCLAPAASRRDDRALVAPAAILTDTVWQGRILIDGSVKVYKGATLTIRPGTEIAFVRRDDDRDGLGDGTLVVEGALRAEGTRRQPIVFRSAADDPRPGDWLELRVDFSRDCLLRYCLIRDSAHTLHAHFTRAQVEDCIIRGNIDGCRLGQGSFVLRRNLIEQNEGKGVNFRNANLLLADNIIRHNGSGVFLFETDRPPQIEHNNLYGNVANLRLGDFFHSDLELGENWWGSSDPEAVAAGIYDHRQDPTLGRVKVGIAPAWLPGTGPRDTLNLVPDWQLATGGFVDAPAVTTSGIAYIPGWDGVLRAVTGAGKLLWQADLGDVGDSAVAVDARAVYVQTWGREVVALNRADGRVLWRFSYPSSPADDHRQGGLLLHGGQLLAPAWNGTLYALDPETGRVLWSFDGRPPLRAQPLATDDRLYLAGGDGTLWCLTADGRLLWERSQPAPLLSTPAAIPGGIAVLARDGTLCALAPDGQLLWQVDLGQECWYGAPLAAEGALFVATAGDSLWRLDAGDGRIVWRRNGLGPSYATPLLAEGRLFIGGNDGRLRVIGADSGDLLAEFAVGAPIQSTPVLLQGRLLFGARDSQLHALALVEADPMPARP